MVGGGWGGGGRRPVHKMPVKCQNVAPKIANSCRKAGCSFLLKVAQKLLIFVNVAQTLLLFKIITGVYTSLT